jgi:hypothetical protein
MFEPILYLKIDVYAIHISVTDIGEDVIDHLYVALTLPKV